MHTTVMFINGTEPISRTPVRLSSDPGAVLVTDDQGRIELALKQGNHTFEIQLGDRWISRPVERSGESPVFIVDIGRQNGAMMSTMNTLQISLASMVGDRFVFETVLGRGGMGIVVKALDRMLGRSVAIKLLSDELQDNEEAQQIFLVEARNLATLSHPNLVAIHDILNVEGRVLMVFEYVLGENVEKMIKRKGRIEQLEALRIIIQLTRVLSYLHENELIHRDLKPANIIIQADGTLKLIDFGLARSLNEIYIRGTRVRGTPAYMAPEQIQGINLTVCTDIYQIGITLYEMLTGDLPFTDGDLSYAHVHTAPDLASSRIPEIDPDLDRVVSWCLEKSPKERPQNATQLLEYFQEIYARLSHGIEGASLPDLSRGSLQTLTPHSITMSESLQSYEVASVSSKRNSLFLAVFVGAALAIVVGLIIATSSRGSDAPKDVDIPAVAVEGDQPTEKPKKATGEESFTVASSIVELGLVSAEGRSMEVASVEKSPTPTDETTNRVAPVARKRFVAKRKQPDKNNEPVEEPIELPVEKPIEKPVEKPKKVAEKKSEVKTISVKKKKKSGLLSVDEEKKKKGSSLLPVD